MTEPQATPEPSADELDSWLTQCLERMADEGEPALEAMCRTHPSAAHALRLQVSTLRSMGLLNDTNPADAIPGRLGGFRLLKRLGSGGMGVVYLAEQESLRREVALKLIRPEHLSFPGARARFRREVEEVARLQHPGIVPVHSVGAESGVSYYTTEHVAGHSLDAILTMLQGRRPEELSGEDFARAVGLAAAKGHLFGSSWVEVCFRIGRQVADALDHAHQHGVIHRDLKPSNIMITPTGRALVVDFGLASTQGTSKLTRTGLQAGSLPYMAPEQLRGDAASIDQRTDVYALGVTLYQMVTLTLPYSSPDSELARKLILDGGAATMRTRNPAVPWDAETVCLTAMDRDPGRRYASAAAFARDLENVLELRPIQARRAGLPLRTRRWVQRHPAMTVALALGVLLVLGAPSALWLQQRAATFALARKNVHLEQRLENAEDATQLARRNFQKAREAVHRMLAQVGDQALRNVPQMETVRRHLLQDAVAFYRDFLSQEERLLDERPTDDEPREHWADASIGLAMALHDQAEDEASAQALREAIPRLREFAESASQPAKFWRFQATALQTLGTVLHASLQSGESVTANEQALQALAEAAKHESPTTRDRELRAKIEHSLADELALLRRFDDAESHGRRAVSSFAALARECPATPEHATNQAASTLTLANVLHELGSNEAETTYRDAIALLRRQEQADTNVASVKTWLARANSELGRLLGRLGRAAEAETVLREAWSRYQEILTRCPGDLDAQIGVPQSMAHLVELNGALHGEERRDLAQQAFEQMLVLVHANPDNRMFHGALRDCFQVLDHVLQSQGDTAAAREARARLSEADD